GSIMNSFRPARAVSEIHPIQSLFAGSADPALDGRNRDLKLCGYQTQRLTSANGSHHVAPSFFKSRFLFIASDLHQRFSDILLSWRCLHIVVMQVLAPVRLRYMSPLMMSLFGICLLRSDLGSQIGLWEK